MDKDGIKGVAAQVRSTIKQAVSKITGDAKTLDAVDAKTRAEGAADDASAKTSTAFGCTTDAARDAAEE